MRTGHSTKRPGRTAKKAAHKPQQAKRSRSTPKGQAQPKQTRRTTKRNQPARQAKRPAANKRARQAARRTRRRRAEEVRCRKEERRYQVSGSAMQAEAQGLFQKHLKLRNLSTRTTAATVFMVLLAAAGQCTSIAAACYRLATAPSEQTIYNALEETLPGYAELERRVNRALRAKLPANLRKRRQRLAVDLTLIPYHGEHLLEEKEVYRGQAKSGTTHFHAYASLYVVCRGERFTIALIRVELATAMKDVVQRLLLWGRRAQIRPKLLLLDRGFYSVEVISYLKRAQVPFLMPAMARGRKPAAGKPVTGIRAFLLRKRGGWGEHTLKSVKRQPKVSRGEQPLKSVKRQTKVSICVCCGNYRGQWKRHGRYAWVYAYWGIKPSSPRWVADTYRTRFGIETSYRQMNQGRIKTCTRCPLHRYLYIAVALILRNVWVWLHWEVLSTPRRGRRRLNLPRLTFEGLLVCLVHAAEVRFGIHEGVWIERRPPALMATAGSG